MLMADLKFTTFAVANEIDLNKIADACGIKKRYAWEEPLLLQGDVLDQVMVEGLPVSARVFVFSFGSIVLINLNQPQTERFIRYLASLFPAIDPEKYKVYQEEYALHVAEGANKASETALRLTDRYVQVPVLQPFHPDLIAVVLAKSAALERIEFQLGKILDALESEIDRLEKGRLRIGNKELAQTTARIVRHEYNTLAYIMILDKPDITWASSEAAVFYDQLAAFFELDARHEVIKSKTEILKGIMDGFTTISQSIRGLFVEWVIVLLIVFEVVLMVYEMFFK